MDFRLGSLIYQGILQSDYNLIMGTITISVISVALTTFVIDLLYPFLIRASAIVREREWQERKTK